MNRERGAKPARIVRGKRMLYVAIILALLLLSAVFVGTMFMMANTIAAGEIESAMEESEARLHTALSYRARDFRYQLVGNREAADAQTAMVQSLRTLESQNKEERYLYATADGAAYTTAGEFLGKIINPAVLEQASRLSFRVTSLDGTAFTATPVAVVAPADDKGDYFAIRCLSADAFATMVLDNMVIAPQQLSLYNASGMLVSGTAVEGEVPFEAVRHESLVAQQKGLRQHYAVYMEMGMPRGWVMAATLMENQVAPMFPTVILSAVISTIVWLFMVAVMVTLDVFNDRVHKQEIYRLQYIDSLTGLTNESGMLEALEAFLAEHSMVEYNLICMDIAAFHRYNVMFGYSGGDLLLGLLARNLRERFECVVRAGGDMFVFLAPKGGGTVPGLQAELRDAVREEIGAEQSGMFAVNCGIYPIQDSDEDVREMYDKCVIALKEAKKTPGLNVEIFGDEVKRRAELHRAIEMNMMHALSKGEFVPYVQPKYAVSDERCCGGEVLVRWDSETMGMLRPDDFIPLFEENGFIVELDLYMLECVLNMQQASFDAGEEMYPMSVNLSKKTLMFPNYLQRLSRLVSAYTVPLNLIEIELTESILQEDSAAAVLRMLALKTQGFLLSMDDFGSGFSSLNTLRELPVDVLKIDREFLQESNASDRSKQIIRSIIGMARDLGIYVVCEGVETRDQVLFLKAANCDVMQGYLYSPPVPYEEFRRKHLPPTE